ncbi:MAG: hypothetical protein ACXWEI_13590, partial [Mycobacterium sp.]
PLPWKERPPFGDLQLVPLLDAQAEIAEACRDVQTGADAAHRLRDIAERHSSPGLDASAALAAARQHLLRGEYPSAIEEASAAVRGWCELDAPFDAAVARVVLGRARAAAGNRAGSVLDLRAAHDEFTVFGASRRAAGVAALLADSHPDAEPDRSRAPLTATMERRGDLWHLAFRGTTWMLADLKGLHYLAVLLAEPGREHRALDLCGGQEVAADIPVIDEDARQAYRRRLSEVEQDIAEAEADNDAGRAERARSDREFLLAELSGAVGLGGRLRGTGGAAERARTSVTRSLRYALARVTEQHGALGEHLGRTVHTGSYCRYEPDPVAPISWTVGR